MSTVVHDFTLEELQWVPWVEAIEESTADEQQKSVFKEIWPSGNVPTFYRVLAHDPVPLLHRMRLYKEVMFGPSGLSRAEREMVSTAVSRSNRCIFCASNHGRTFITLSKAPDVAQQIIEDYTKADLSPRHKAILDYSVKLNENPASVTVQDIELLRQVGLSDLDIFDLCHVAAIFSWANRLSECLGEATE